MEIHSHTINNPVEIGHNQPASINSSHNPSHNPSSSSPNNMLSAMGMVPTATNTSGTGSPLQTILQPSFSSSSIQGMTSTGTSHAVSNTTSSCPIISTTTPGIHSPSIQQNTHSQSTISPSPNVSKKPEDIVTYHAHIEDEHVLEYCPLGRYGKLNVILGKGAYKVVWKALDFKDGYEVAWNSFQTTKQESAELSQEIEILKKVRHPNIISFRDAWYNNGEFVFITELITSGTLRE